jgi:5-methylthioadenosine/S-adenosylhomocysteine deaminase
MLLKARWVLPITGEAIEHGAVLVDGDRIVAVGPASEISLGEESAPWRDFGEAVLLPGLVNAHSHLELTVMRGMLEDDDFRTWITRLTTIKLERMTREDLLDSARLGALEAVRAGVTCLADTCDSGVSVEALTDAGLRGIVYQEVFGPDPAQADASIRSLVEKLDRLEAGIDGLVRVGVSPHAPFTVSAELFRRVTELSLERLLPMAIHAAESAAERNFLFDGSGPFGERFRDRGIAWDPPGESTIAWLDSLGVLAARPLLIHAVHATPRDLELIGSANASVVHCPKSNAKLGHGVAPVRDMLANGLRVGIGTDSVASNNLCDILDEARSAVFMARAAARDAGAMSARNALELATIGGAEALGLERDIGSIEPGKLADLCVVSLDGLHASPIHDVEAALVFSCAAKDVAMTMVGGVAVYERDAGGATLLDEDRLLARLGEIGRAISAPTSG